MLQSYNVPGGRFWEPGKEWDSEELEAEWAEFEAFVKANGVVYDEDLPFN